jgi:hypothetical protein
MLTCPSYRAIPFSGGEPQLLDVKCENSRGEFAKMNKVVEPSCRGIECCPEHVHVCICCIYILVCAKSGTTISYYF